MKTATISLALLGVFGLAACGGGSSGTVAAAPAATPSAQAAGQGGPPGVSGLLAAVQGSTLQVQGPSSQTAVVYTSATAITATVPATSADVAVGQCAAVRSAAGGGSPAATVAATSVTISAPVNGSCAPGAGGGGGPGGPRGMRPSGAPNGTPPSGAPGGGRGFGGGAFGKITAVSGSGFTVASGGGAPGASPSGTTSPVVVTTTSATTFTKQQAATATALKQGVCVTARGAQDSSSGTVTATSIAVRPAVNGTCTGFGGRNG